MAIGMFGSSLSPFNPVDPRYLTGTSFNPSADGSIMPQPTGPIPGVPRAPDAVAKTSFFGDGGPGRAIAGNIGDTLLQLAHMRPIYGPALQAQREFAMRRQLAQMEGQRTLGNELALYNYKLKNPAPSDDAFTRALQMAGVDPASDQGKQLSLQRAEALAQDPNDAFVATSLPGDRFYAGPKSGLPAALGALSGQSGNLDATPTAEDGYQYTPGPGGRANQANWKPLGGATGNGSGTFRG